MQFVDFGALAHSEMKAEVESTLTRILNSEQFRRSQRSRLFLQTILQKALAGDFASLKERILGIELFRRDASFDTDRDAVVRVAANDVRNRLHDFYSNNPDVRIIIGLPPGRYVPTIEVRGDTPTATVPVSKADSSATASSNTAVADAPATQPKASTPNTPVSPIAPPPERAIAPAHIVMHPMALRIIAVALVVIVVGLSGILWRVTRDSQVHSPDIAALPPWSQLIAPGKRLGFVLADANLVAATVMQNKSIPIEEYATHKFNYLPNTQNQFSAYLNDIPLTTLSDATIATRIAELVTRAGGETQVLYSNRIDISTIRGDAPLLFVGSATSNPWVQLFTDQLNFQITHKFDSGMDICINREPQAGEQATYTPVRNPAGVSEGYALIALLPNLTGKANVLIIAGTSTEATEAAGEFVVNASELSDALKSQKIQTSHPQHLEFLIKTSFVSGSAARSEVIASRVR